jgi:shikimate dehydrogenase
MGIRKFAVLGDPIDHSLSPIIHQAAYKALDLNWQYSRIKVNDHQLSSFLSEESFAYAGLSLTMPLKDELVRIANERGWQIDEAAVLLGCANTLVRHDDGRIIVANTDLVGAKKALKVVPTSVTSAAILGSGATARTLSLATLQVFRELESLTVFSRRPEPAQLIASLVDQTNATVKFEWLPIEAAADFGGADLTVNTLPSTVSKTVEVDLPFSQSFVFDVTYDGGEDSPASQWPLENRVDGRNMLVYQAVEQLRLFGAFSEGDRNVTGEEVASAMFAAIL